MCPAVESYAKNRTDESVTKWIQYYIACEGSNPLAHVITEAKLAAFETGAKLNYTLKHYTPDKKQLVEQLEDALIKLHLLQGKLADLSNCNKTGENYATAKSKICINILNLLAGDFLIGTVAAILFFEALWTSLKYRARVLVTKNHKYMPINQDSEAVFTDSFSRAGTYEINTL